MNPLRGEKHPKSVISDDDAYNLKRRALLGERLKDLAEEYNVSISLACNIRNGKSHPHIVVDDVEHTRGVRNGQNHWMTHLTEDDIRDIFRLYPLGWRIQKLAEMKNVIPCTISSILYGKTWKNVCPEIPRFKPRSGDKKRRVSLPRKKRTVNYDG